MRQCKSNHELDFHSRRKLIGCLFVVNFKKLYIFQILFFVPLVTVKRPDSILDRKKLLLWIKIYSAEHNADIFLAFGFIFGDVHSENFRRTRIGMNHIEHSFNRCAFACTVSADKAHNLSAFNLERNIFQLKLGIFFANFINLQDFHFPQHL